MPSPSMSAEAMATGCGCASIPGRCSEGAEPTWFTCKGRFSCSQILGPEEMGPEGALCAALGPAAKAGLIRLRHVTARTRHARMRTRGVNEHLVTACNSL